MREETGYQSLRVLGDLGYLSNTYRRSADVQVTRNESFFLMTLDDATQGERSREDHARFEVMWVPIEEAETLLTFDAEREFIRRARRLNLSSLSEGESDAPS